MKRLALVLGILAGLVGAVVLAAPDVDPWVSKWDRVIFHRPQAFEQLLQVNSIDAGILNAASILATTVVASGAITSGSALTSGTFPCDGGTPAPTFTVTAGVHCTCGGLGAACTVSSTTLTTHCVAGDTVGVGYVCL